MIQVIIKGQDEMRFDVIRKDLVVGMAQAGKGEFVDFDVESIKAEGRARLSKATDS